MGGGLVVIASSDHQSNNSSDQYQQTFYVAEHALLEAEKRLIFQQLFSKQTCAKIYQKLKYGLKKKLDDDVRMELYHNRKRINIDEEKALRT